ncbi:MAG TPA: hypothetical protein PK948_08145 [Gemmatimonadales bacterium]|nr:hypothetical protein [Gemmatimonadales bacterium]
MMYETEGDTMVNVNPEIHIAGGAQQEWRIVRVHYGDHGIDYTTPSPWAFAATVAGWKQIGTPLGLAQAIAAQGSPWAAHFAAVGSAFTAAGVALSVRDQAYFDSFAAV